MDARLETVAIAVPDKGACHDASRGLSPQRALQIALSHRRARCLLINIILAEEDDCPAYDVACEALTGLARQLSSLPTRSWPSIEALTFNFCESTEDYCVPPKFLTTLVSLTPNIKTLHGLVLQPRDMLCFIPALPYALQDLELAVQEISVGGIAP